MGVGWRGFSRRGKLVLQGFGAGFHEVEIDRDQEVVLGGVEEGKVDVHGTDQN